MQTNNITEMKMFFGIVILLSFLVTNPLIYSFTLKVVLFENSNRTLSFDSWNKNMNGVRTHLLSKTYVDFMWLLLKKADTNSLLQQ